MKYICGYLKEGWEDGNGVSESFFYCFLNGLKDSIYAPCEKGNIFTCPFKSNDRVKKMALSIRDKLIEERDLIRDKLKAERDIIERLTERLTELVE